MGFVKNKEAVGKLIVRIIVGALMMAHGVILFIGGKNGLISIGEICSVFGISGRHLFGILGGILATFCIISGMTFILGVFFRATSLILGTIFLMDAAFKYFLLRRPLFPSVSYIVMASSFMYCFALLGAGEYSAQKG